MWSCGECGKSWDEEEPYRQHLLATGHTGISESKDHSGELNDSALLPTLESLTESHETEEDIPTMAENPQEVTSEETINTESFESGGGEFGGAGASEDF